MVVLLGTAGREPTAEEAKPASELAGDAGTTAARQEEDEREPSGLMLFLLCAVSALEGADTALLPAVMFALQKNVGMKFTDLAYLALAQAVCTNIAAPLWGIIADRGCLRRRSILIIGAMSQGVITVLLGITTGNLGPVVPPMVALRALEGSALAALRPISNGMVADATSESRRGKIFGRVQSSLLFGMFASGMIATPMSNQTIFGVAGWRIAFCLCGSLAMAVAGMVALLLVEPPRPEAEAPAAAGRRGACAAVVEELAELLSFFSIPTFGVMIMQGIFGTIPWSVMGNMTLFFQLAGQPDARAAVLTGEQAVTGAFGNLLGGLVADFLARRFGYHGRPLSAQITVSVGIPIIWLIFMGVPPGQGSFAVYFVLIAGFGLLGSWAQSGTNFPVLSEIVPASARSRVMAWECALENSIANALGPPVVALLATKCFGYTFGEAEDSGPSSESAAALGKAMTVVICGPWLVCLAAYSLLHWSYPRDVRRLAAKRQQKEQTSEVKPEQSCSTAGSETAQV